MFLISLEDYKSLLINSLALSLLAAIIKNDANESYNGDLQLDNIITLMFFGF